MKITGRIRVHLQHEFTYDRVDLENLENLSKVLNGSTMYIVFTDDNTNREYIIDTKYALGLMRQVISDTSVAKFICKGSKFDIIKEELQ